MRTLEDLSDFIQDHYTQLERTVAAGLNKAAKEAGNEDSPDVVQALATRLSVTCQKIVASIHEMALSRARARNPDPQLEFEFPSPSGKGVN